MSKSLFIISSLALAVAAFGVGNQFDNLFPSLGNATKAGDSAHVAIQVKGIAEAEYAATEGTWSVGIRAWGKDYKEALNVNKEQLVTLVQFLVTQGFSQDNFELQPVTVEEYIERIEEKGREITRRNGFYANRLIKVKTKNIDTLKKAYANIQDLRAINNTIVFGNPEYYLDNLEAIKAELLGKAIENAYVRAGSMAKSANSSLGKLKSAEQGLFEVLPDNAKTTEIATSESLDTSTIKKKVRITVSTQYAIQ